ncbi:YbfB/YjiJ family MFS transporter [Limnohabitans sp. MMS-10A-178]|uniref:YbfB/YjiJ family MFS transporter n=1 Tax=Limnohabitans sp. MMS-10A-178 TaxID=1835767 RepID=UPI000D33BE3F|nr:YbfB/YjiJ family MFS transporter [Limnohabitans sp. MMS-10A-178]PUE16269.1 MFS transporter [Limnohabitans sp. MMS-10A-178]
MTQSIRFFSALWLAICISMAAAVSLGITRFAYALLLPPMREDLSWTYTLSGSMNTFNALGYLIGALLTPRILSQWGAVRVLIGGALMASLLMVATGFFSDTSILLIQRLLAGMASAAVFVSGGLLAARLGTHLPAQSGLLLGIYYGGTGLGISLSAVLVPIAMDLATQNGQLHEWAWAWWALGLACFAMTVLLFFIRRSMLQFMPEVNASTSIDSQAEKRVRKMHWPEWTFGLTAYGLFGVGYIGYMTFVVAVLREQGANASQITFFYAMLGLAVLASSRVWANLLNRYQGGQALSILSALLSVATVIPALTSAWPLMMVSGILFGGVFLSVVASTTAMVKHNLAPSQWAAGISVFTVVFAAGQIVGPTVVGWIADGPGGLQRGLVFSAAALLLGALLAWQQKPIHQS